eukprot:300130-Alexandrium_andersonii.AAC.1
MPSAPIAAAWGHTCLSLRTRRAKVTAKYRAEQAAGPSQCCVRCQGRRTGAVQGPSSVEERARARARQGQRNG